MSSNTFHKQLSGAASVAHVLHSRSAVNHLREKAIVAVESTMMTEGLYSRDTAPPMCASVVTFKCPRNSQRVGNVIAVVGLGEFACLVIRSTIVIGFRKYKEALARKLDASGLTR